MHFQLQTLSCDGAQAQKLTLWNALRNVGDQVGGADGWERERGAREREKPN